MTRKKSEDAVSPIIGVMLMLVVTVVIAAVVAVFATGMVEDTEPAPIAKLNVKIIHDQPVRWGESMSKSTIQHSGTVPTLHLTHVSGDPLDTADLKLSFSWECENPDCTIKDHTSTYQAGNGDKITHGTGSAFGGLAFVTRDYGGTIEPLYINYDNAGGAFFGYHILKRGETMVAYEKHLMIPDDDVEMAGNPAMEVLFNNGDVDITYSQSERSETTEYATSGYVWLDEIEGHSDSCTKKDKHWQHWYNMDGFTTPCCGAIVPCPFCGAKKGATVISYYEVICNSCGKNTEEIIVHTKTEIIGTGYSAGIMECLPEGTAVKVMITHIPSNKVIYEDRVFVE